MGDIIHALPAAAALRRRFPKSKFRWAVEPHWAPLVEAAAGPDGAVPIPIHQWRRAPLAGAHRQQLRQVRDRLHGGYTLAVDLQGLLKSGAVCWLSGAQRVIGFDTRSARERAAACFYTERVRATQGHVVERYLSVAQAAGAEAAPPEFQLPEGYRDPALPADYILMSPRAGWTSKEWPRDHITDLAREIRAEFDCPLVLDVAPNDRELAQSIAAEAGPETCEVHVSDLPGLIGATRAARAVVGVDSGPMHLAAALGMPGVAIFGPTDPERNGPYGGTLRVLRHPSAKTTYKRGKETDPSMAAIQPAAVITQLREILCGG